MNGRVKGRVPVLLLTVSSLLYMSCKQQQTTYMDLNEKEMLGKRIFFDESLSEPAGQSCATCHTPERGFADVEARIASEGAVKGLFSNRNAQTCTYTAYIPALYYDADEETYIGGLFWDGRVNTLEEQALQPFTNPLEMGNHDYQMLVDKIKRTAYYVDFVHIYGESSVVDTIIANVADAIATYERSVELNPFTSKYDAWKAGKCELTKQEKRGYKLFKKKALCAECHILDKDDRAGEVLFTDHTYDNLGIPSNPENPFYLVSAPYNLCGRDTVDLGLGAFLQDSDEYGKFRVPTLRNIALTAPYGHNGYFKTLEEIVHFYNVRDIENFPPAEYPATVNKDELGNLGLTPQEEADIVAFMNTLTDGYRIDAEDE